MKKQIYETSSKRLRVHDSYAVTHKAEINAQLEQNYQRGFQQGIVFLLAAMKARGVAYISQSEIELASELAGQMRFRMTHFLYHGDEFSHRLSKLLAGVEK